MPENLYTLMFHANKWGLSGYTRGAGKTTGGPNGFIETLFSNKLFIKNISFLAEDKFHPTPLLFQGK